MNELNSAEVATAQVGITPPHEYADCEDEAVQAFPPERLESPHNDLYRVMMSPAVEENFGHFLPHERLKQASYLREIARQLEVSAKVAITDKEWEKHPEFIPAESWEQRLN